MAGCDSSTARRHNERRALLHLVDFSNLREVLCHSIAATARERESVHADVCACVFLGGLGEKV